MSSLLAAFHRVPVHQRWFAVASVAITAFIAAIFLANIPIRRVPTLIYVASWHAGRTQADALANGVKPVSTRNPTAHPAR